MVSEPLKDILPIRIFHEIAFVNIFKIILCQGIVPVYFSQTSE